MAEVSRLFLVTCTDIDGNLQEFTLDEDEAELLRDFLARNLPEEKKKR